MKQLAILARMMELLSEYSEEQFLEAAAVNGITREASAALRALAAAKTSFTSPGTTPATSDSVPSRTEPATDASGPSRRRGHRAKGERYSPSRNYEAQIRRLAGNATAFPSTASLANFLGHRGIQISYRPGDSKERLLRRLLRELDSAEPIEREKKLAVLFGTAGDRTERWFDVIRGAR